MKILQHKERKELVQGHVANWWQDLEKNFVGLTHSSSDTPAIISLLLLSWCICSIVSNQICSHLPIAHGSKAVIFGGPIMERKIWPFSLPFSPPHLDNSVMQILYFLRKFIEIEEGSVWQEQWMHCRKSLLCSALQRSLFSSVTVQPDHQEIQWRYFSNQLYKMQEEAVWFGRAGERAWMRDRDLQVAL